MNIIRFFLKFSSITIVCGAVAFFSTKWNKTELEGNLNKVSFNNKGEILSEVKRLEDVDVWGKQHGCSFIFVKDWNKKEIYTAIGYAEANGGRGKKVNPWSPKITWEKAIIDAVNKNKIYCLEKLRTFTFLWSRMESKFYIGNPNERPSVRSSLQIGLT